jgi:poly(A) polymerase
VKVKKKEKIQLPPVVSVGRHHIPHVEISKNALKVLSQLKEAGFSAYLVGGGVRDLLLGGKPKDFDIVTDARPEEVKQVFRNCRLIGKRFRLAHVHFGREIIDVATFRRTEEMHAKLKYSDNGMIVRDNVYGNLEEDVWRRDFTINAIYYDISDSSFLDYTGGLEDLEKRVLRVIGDPIQRYQEDPVRMFRAIRFAAKLGFELEEQTAKAIFQLAGLLRNVSNARLLEEVTKWFRSGKSLAVFELLCTYGIFALLFPQTEKTLAKGKFANICRAMVQQGFSNTDQRLVDGKTLNPAFMFAVLLWWPLQELILNLRKKGLDEEEVFFKAIRSVLKEQNKIVLLPRKFTSMIEEVWLLQYQLEKRDKRKIYPIFQNPKFRAAYDFLLLRAESGEEGVKEAAEWWGKFQES